MSPLDQTLITRLTLRNYKSISACRVELGSLTYLVGPNGSGKSNFVDALRFLADALRHSLDHALRDRGGISEVRRRSSGHPTHFGIRAEYSLAPAVKGHFAFEIAAKPNGGYCVQNEECYTSRPDGTWIYYKVGSGSVAAANFPSPPAAVDDRLYLVNVSGLPDFRPLYDALSHMGFYNLNPADIRDLQPPDPGEILSRTGGNLASVLSRIKAESPETKARIEEYMHAVVPAVSGVESKVIGHKESLEFRQEVAGASHPWRFPAASMSDGTLRALGVLVALYQSGANGGARRARLVAIEEPEVALHPAAAGILTDCLREATGSAQVLVTSHSPDLLDNESIPDSSIVAVVSEEGDSHIGHVDNAGRSALREHLYTAGELLRMDQLRPDESSKIRVDQVNLFGVGTSE